MSAEQLTVEQCNELANALREDAACLPHGADREKLMRLAENYRVLGQMKRMVVGRVN
jgi:hypothetical protein